MIDGILPPGRPLNSGSGKIPKQDTNTPAEPAFRPPEAVAAEDEWSDSDIPEKAPVAYKRRWHLKVNRLQAILIAGAFVVLLGSGAAAYILTNKKKPVVKATAPVPAVIKKEEPPKPTTIASPLTGIQVTPDLGALPVTGVMIENSPDARPQSGLKDAGVVFEAIAEGGITRFLALFQEAQPDYVGPVRSARPYYLEWLQGFDASIAHVGGSPEALALIKAVGIKDLDQFYNSGSYQRITTRYAPHNVYTSLAKLIALEKTKGFTGSTFTGFGRKAEKPSATITARSIDLGLSGYLYNVHYDYDAASNSYLRSEGGKAHIDERSKAQLSPKVVVALVVPYGIKSDGLHSDYKTTGNGKAYIFQDGTVTEGTWEKTGSKEPLRFGDANGSPLALNAGQTWITAVSASSKVSSKP